MSIRRGFAYATLLLALPNPLRTRANPICHSITLLAGAGISTCCPSTTPFGLALGPDFPRADKPSPGNLGLPAGGILTRLLATHSCILTSDTSSRPYSLPSSAYRTLSYQDAKASSTASVYVLAPLHLRRRYSRPVSYYALF